MSCVDLPSGMSGFGNCKQKGVKKYTAIAATYGVPPLPSFSGSVAIPIGPCCPPDPDNACHYLASCQDPQTIALGAAINAAEEAYMNYLEPGVLYQALRQYLLGTEFAHGGYSTFSFCRFSLKRYSAGKATWTERQTRTVADPDYGTVGTRTVWTADVYLDWDFNLANRPVNQIQWTAHVLTNYDDVYNGAADPIYNDYRGSADASGGTTTEVNKYDGCGWLVCGSEGDCGVNDAGVVPCDTNDGPPANTALKFLVHTTTPVSTAPIDFLLDDVFYYTGCPASNASFSVSGGDNSGNVQLQAHSVQSVKFEGDPTEPCQGYYSTPKTWDDTSANWSLNMWDTGGDAKALVDAAVANIDWSTIPANTAVTDRFSNGSSPARTSEAIPIHYFDSSQLGGAHTGEPYVSIAEAPLSVEMEMSYNGACCDYTGAPPECNGDAIYDYRQWNYYQLSAVQLTEPDKLCAVHTPQLAVLDTTSPCGSGHCYAPANPDTDIVGHYTTYLGQSPACVSAPAPSSAPIVISAKSYGPGVTQIYRNYPAVYDGGVYYGHFPAGVYPDCCFSPLPTPSVTNTSADKNKSTDPTPLSTD